MTDHPRAFRSILVVLSFVAYWTAVAQDVGENLEDLIVWSEDLQESTIPIAPPTETHVHAAGWPDFFSFDPDAIPSAMLSNMWGDVKHESPVYPIFLMEDADTRETVFLNMYSEEIHAIPAPDGYNPHAYAEERFPNLYTSGRSTQEIQAILDLYDPARIIVNVTLIPEEFIGSYLYGQGMGTGHLFKPGL